MNKAQLGKIADSLDKLAKKYHIQLWIQQYQRSDPLGITWEHKGERYFRTHFRDASHLFNAVPIFVNVIEEKRTGAFVDKRASTSHDPLKMSQVEDNILIFYEWEDLFKIYRDSKRRDTLPEIRGFIEDRKKDASSLPWYKIVIAKIKKLLDK